MQPGGAHNYFKRVRVLYGSEQIEDIMEYGTIARILIEFGAAQSYMSSSGSIIDGTYGMKGSSPHGPLVNSSHKTAETMAKIQMCGIRTFTLNLFSGLFTCKKLIPLKFLASQLALELTLSKDAEVYNSSGAPAMKINRVNFIGELLEFDSTYDAAFFAGMARNGVPLLFNSWHHHSFNVTGTEQTFQIQERARSVKSAIAVIKDAVQPSFKFDSDIFYHDLGMWPDATGRFIGSQQNEEANQVGAALIKEYQYRIGGRYYPSQPVRCCNGGAEAYIELMKVAGTLGDYRQDCSIDVTEWQAQGNTLQSEQ